MSADNWAICPACLARAQAARQLLEARVAAAYGVLPIAEFDALRSTLDTPIDLDPSFREDYEIYGAETGIITVTYGGRCQAPECNAGVKFEHHHPVEGVPT